MKNLSATSVGAMLALVLMPGCGQPREDATPVPAQLVLYSLDGTQYEPSRPVPSGVATFHGVPVLGQAEITRADARREIMSALHDGMKRSDGTMARCFWPRHGIRTIDQGKTTDYVVCFECLQLAIHRGEFTETVATTRHPLRAFNAQLKAAGLPLAPGIPGMTKPDGS